VTRDLTIKAASVEDKPVFSNLIQLYLYDMTEYLPFPIGDNGKYEYDMLDHFWQHPYLFYVNGELVGFALVIDKCPITQKQPCWFMAEFFILKPYRKKGIGQACVKKTLAEYPGIWHIGTITKNVAAASFWQKIINQYDNVEMLDKQHDGERWNLYEFEIQ